MSPICIYSQQTVTQAELMTFKNRHRIHGTYGELPAVCMHPDRTGVHREANLSQFTLNIPQKNEGAEDTKYLRGSGK